MRKKNAFLLHRVATRREKSLALEGAPPRLRLMAPRLRVMTAGCSCLTNKHWRVNRTDCQILCLLEMSSFMKRSFCARMRECLAVKMLNSWRSDRWGQTFIQSDAPQSDPHSVNPGAQY
ncbi:hypothetical protein BSKO_05185 [Bryopsis sp. KO-2023]|nr:hypothetical protein BSKO_05185 [Bryopsis sp. KO-2023]